MSMFVMTIGVWKPGIGDPSIMGWLTVLSYYIVALLCAVKMVAEKRLPEKNDTPFWGVLCFALIILGFIKQFNLLSALTEVGRIIARSGGWLEQRGAVQAWTMVLVSIIGLTVSGLLYRRLSKSFSRQKKWAFFGLVYLLLFVLFRGISLHGFGTVLNYRILGARMNWIAEWFGIYWIGLSIFWPQRRTGDP